MPIPPEFKLRITRRDTVPLGEGQYVKPERPEFIRNPRNAGRRGFLGTVLKVLKEF